MKTQNQKEEVAKVGEDGSFVTSGLGTNVEEAFKKYMADWTEKRRG